jgi:hypothetical protein
MLGTQIWTHTHVLSGILILGLRLRIVFGWWLQVRISFSIPTKGMKITNDLKRGLAMGPTSVIRTRIYNDIQLYQILVHAIYIYMYIYTCIFIRTYIDAPASVAMMWSSPGHDAMGSKSPRFCGKDSSSPVFWGTNRVMRWKIHKLAAYKKLMGNI